MAGWRFSSGESATTCRDNPVTSSTSSCNVTPSCRSLELNGAADLRQDREGVRIPLDHDLSERDLIALVDFQLGAVHHGVALALATFVVHHGDRALAIHHYQVARLGLHRLQPDKAH